MIWNLRLSHEAVVSKIGNHDQHDITRKVCERATPP